MHVCVRACVCVCMCVRVGVRVCAGVLCADGYLPDAPGQLLAHHCLAQVADLLHLQCSAMEKVC